MVSSMKFLLVVFFTLCFPFLVFLTAIVLMPDITPLLKTDLAKQQIYEQLSKQFGSVQSQDAESQLIGTFMQNKFTPDYLQKKTETAMDYSADWVTGKSTTPPVLSFADIKDDLTAQNPQLIPTIEALSKQTKEQDLQQSDGITTIDMLAKSDFSIKLAPYLVGLKSAYMTIRILQPILAILLIVCLVLLFILNKTWSAKLTWIGIALTLSGIWGYAIVYGNNMIMQILTPLVAQNTNTFMQAFAPLALTLVKHVVDTYVEYQKMASLVVLVTAGAAFVGVVLAKRSAPAVVKLKNTSKK